MTQKQSIQLFEEKKARAVWDGKDEGIPPLNAKDGVPLQRNQVNTLNTKKK